MTPHTCPRHGTEYQPKACAICRGFVPRTKQQLRAQRLIPRRLMPLPCVHLGEPTGETRQCEGCGNLQKQAPLFACKVHGVCTETNPVKGIAMCRGCTDRVETPRLIVNMGAGGIGDGLLGLLAVGGLRKHRPGKHLTYRVAPLARDFVRLFDGGYDLLELNDWDGGGDNTPRTGDLQANADYKAGHSRSRIDRYLANVGAREEAFPKLRDRERIQKEWARYAGCIAISTFSTDWAREYPRLDELETRLTARGYRVVFLDSKPERMTHLKSEQIVNGSPEQVAGIFLNAACVVAVDSGMGHLAGVLQCPAIILHNTDSPHKAEHIFDAYPTCRLVAGLPHVDPAFVADEICLPLETGGRSLVSHDRLQVIRDCVLATNHLDGDTAELGVYQGGVSKLILHHSQAGTHHLFDTFTGIPGDDIAEGGHHKAGDFATDVDEVRAFIDNPRAVFHVGEFPATVPAEEIRYRLVHIDGDTYQTTKAAIEYFRPRMVPGGVMVFDDYGWVHCPGVRQAIEEAGLPVETPAANQCIVRF